MGRRLAPTPKPYDRADGTRVWRVRLRVGAKQTTETFRSEAAAASFCEQIVLLGPAQAVQHRDRLDASSESYVPTMSEMLSRHVEMLTGVDPRTRRDYFRVAERSWLPGLRHLPVSAVDRRVVARWVNEQERAGSAAKTIKNAHSLLSGVLNSAVQDGHVTVNPAKGTHLPRAGEETRVDNRYLTHEEFARLYDAMPEHWRPFVLTMFGTGARFSELTALQVRDIDLQHGTMRIVRAWKDNGNRIGPPKSRASRRTIGLPAEVLIALAPLIRERPGDALLFTGPMGAQVWHSAFYQRAWRRSCDAAGLSPRPRIHDARHTHASWLIAQGVRLEVVQDRLGHEDFAVTRRVYGHLMPDLRAEAAAAASAAFDRVSFAPALPSPTAAD